MKNLHQKTLTELQSCLSNGDCSSQELAEHFLYRIEANDQLNAFITVDEQRTLEQAKQADVALKDNLGSALTGIPLAHKDIFCTDGLLTTCGSKILNNFISPYDATVVSRLSHAGMVTLGKTNMDEFAMGSSNETSYYGVVSNPWNTNAVPGGSSGGSAAAVSAGLAPAATGTDTGGSIRQPAAFCGITGVKPSYGRVSRYGMIAFASSLDQAGPMARTAEDAALLLDVMCGFDEHDSTSLRQDPVNFSAQLDKSIEGLKIGLPKSFFSQGLDAEVGDVIDTSIKTLEKMGATIVDINLPSSELAVPCYYVLAPAEASSNLSRFDGVRFGHRAKEYDDLGDMYQKSRSEGFGDEVKRRIMIGTYALSSGYYDAYYSKAQKLRRLISNDFDLAFKQCDIILSPTTPSVAFDKNAKTDDPIAMYLNDIYTIPANLAGLPAISLPAGLNPQGMPIGLHLVAPYLEEGRMLNIAHQFQLNTDFHRAFPENYA
ncbi:MAG: Asp-tRNA(Asn)/Glu-tRNA(Gln) amidotransferase subunit GatA [Arenicellaceae bacterium]|nr:Asp-tRNA(Asn)/Glu-tRNA(Gln) amidotransferase subunit GatA [Arenicellaceae bacterium]